MSNQQQMLEFCAQVEQEVFKQCGSADGGDLCFNLLEQGVIKMEQGVARAAQQVAQYLAQQ